MSHIKDYLLGSLEKAEVLAEEVESRYYTAAALWKIDDPDILVSLIDEPIAELLQIRKELIQLGGRNEAAHIRLPKEILVTVLKAKTWEAVQQWYRDHGLELDVEQDDYLARLQLPDVPA